MIPHDAFLLELFTELLIELDSLLEAFFDAEHPNRKHNIELINATFIGYAPSKNPKLAVAVVFPGLDPDMEGKYTLQVAKAMIQDYFKLHSTK